MSLQQIQFLDENYMVESGTRLGGGSRPRVSSMLGGSGSSLTALEFEFGGASISNLNGRSGSFGLISIRFAAERAPENVFLFVAREHDSSEEFGDFVIVPRDNGTRTNFSNIPGYQLH